MADKIVKHYEMNFRVTGLDVETFRPDEAAEVLIEKFGGNWMPLVDCPKFLCDEQVE